MLQDPQSIRYYQRITDSLVDHWHRGYRPDELRLYLEGYLTALRHASILEPYQINQLEQDVWRYVSDTSNFAISEAQPDFDFF